MRAHTVHAVIAVKGLELAKTRLADRLPAAARARLVLAMLTDTVTAAAAGGVGAVTVVTPDATVAATARELGAHVLPDPAAGLNAALSAGAAAARATGPVDVLALQADLPALRPSEVRHLLAVAPARGRALVRDHTGEGTAALLARAETAALDPRFGPDSAVRHLGSGAVEPTGSWPGLRLDVDTAADLSAAVTLGVGRATAAVLDDLPWPVHRDVTCGAAPGHTCAG
ncbi:2-phospho-L-lactate guanylyltransferase [Nocardia stercoris]|uniref:Phosphoenolpyruvate guanylyltransferase n=1 Tax=Nocardia stercoris TaxID=2483361 RepID=A0A3M2LDC2_9NOCA|nr:2-phospho-L-lactate guanylyltransferase [Nocardia stercoris]RMI35511.1 2-phospho-L-lactate guanylyltransferase [Nocardia stercoris]